jgi:hypothetical protein
MRDHQRRSLDTLNDVGHRKCLAAAGHAQQGLVPLALSDPRHQRIDRRGLVALWFERTLYLELSHRHRNKRITAKAEKIKGQCA